MYFFKVDISSFDDEAETVFIIPEQNADENGVPFEEKIITQTAEYKAFVKRTKTALVDCAYTQYQTEAVADGLNDEKFAQLETEGKLAVIDANTYSISTGKSAKCASPRSRLFPYSSNSSAMSSDASMEVCRNCRHLSRAFFTAEVSSSSSKGLKI